MPSVFDPIALRGAEFRNRIWVSPMCQYSCLDHDGVPNDWHLMHLGQFAAGGAGLVMAEATGVSPEGRITRECAGLWNDEQQQAWTRVVAFAHSQGTKVGIQLGHAGRKGSDYTLTDPRSDTTVPVAEGGWEPVAPSAIACPSFDTPRALEAAEIHEVIGQFASSARRAVAAGFDLVEIHGAHGYLIHQFLSPLSNARTDEFGGSLENRMRLALMVARAVREAVGPDFPVFMRLSATDWIEGGWDLEQTAVLAQQLREAGIDLIDVSTGGLLPSASIPVGDEYQVPFAAEIRKRAGIATAAVGLVRTLETAERIVGSEDADAVFIGREFLRDPHLPLRFATAAEQQISDWPYQYRFVHMPAR